MMNKRETSKIEFTTMKKIKLLIVLIVGGLNCYSHPDGKNTLSLNLGSSAFSGVMDKSSEMGINCAVSLKRFHFALSTNLMNNNRALDLGVANVGFILPVNYLVSMVPVMGIGFSGGNHSGSYHSDIIHTNDSTYYINAGFMCLMKLGKNVGFYTGIGTFESFRIGVTFAFL